ncbi:hypothetical protein BDN72DRAFT_838802 [Pluteus cervinus]|uniref:Uncharacterized protein n=1 Tax=Pluteus cervinus TaxID=181527 RepID=A0ACD3AYY5_9AGAR|nr:hypothetical protein BDN72DRAFT_838802 [Pluteus cervinus]
MAQIRRSSSCPPPDSTPVSTLREGSLPTPLVTRDDLARRPSRVVMYQSNSPTRFFFPQDSTLASGYTSHCPPQQAFTFPWAQGLHLNPSISIGAYHALPDTFGWDSMPSRDPQLWTNWESSPLRQTPAPNSTLPMENNGNLVQHGRQHIQHVTYNPNANTDDAAAYASMANQGALGLNPSMGMRQVHEKPVFTNPFASRTPFSPYETPTVSGATTPQQGGSSRRASPSPSPLDSSSSGGIIDLERTLLSEWTNDTDFIASSGPSGITDLHESSPNHTNANDAQAQDVVSSKWPFTPEQGNELWDLAYPASNEPTAFDTNVDDISAQAISELFAGVDTNSLRVGLGPYPEPTDCHDLLHGDKRRVAKSLKMTSLSADEAVKAYRRILPLPDLHPVIIRQSRDVGL